MDRPNLPQHVVERVERRWAAAFSHQAMPRPIRNVGRNLGMKDPSPGSQEAGAQPGDRPPNSNDEATTDAGGRA